ncbi:histidine kinase [Arthrobacter sp. lap29]|uniref:sensor histidine kinase n=1 Tax=Arthrobacter sp. lap29 TaxID=3056122 RepID=UPI0028F720A6|nr:histidine kinase [Arthrobacter sp. lap29]
MKIKLLAPESPWRTVALVVAVVVADVLMSVLSIGLGIDDGTVPDPENAGLEWARFGFAPLLAPLGAVALIWRHRFPRSVAATAAVLGVLSFSGVAFFVALFLLAQRRLDWWVAAVIALAIGTEALLGIDTAHWHYILLLLVFVYGAIAVWGAYRGQRRRLRESQLTELTNQAARAQAERVTDAERTRLAERHRIAREMHDTLAHRMSLVAVQAAAMQVDAPDPETASSARLIRETAHAALGELRDVLGVLREDGTNADERSYAANAPSGVGAPSDVTAPSGVAAPSGIAQIAGLVAQWRLAGILVDYSQLPEDPVVIPDAVSRAAFRVVQEGLTNVARHAPGSRAHVNLELPAATTGPAELHVTVANGAGGPGEPGPGAGLGLVGLSERVQILGGTVEHGHNAQGFELVACIPFTPVLHNHSADCEGASA